MSSVPPAPGASYVPDLDLAVEHFERQIEICSTQLVNVTAKLVAVLREPYTREAMTPRARAFLDRIEVAVEKMNVPVRALRSETSAGKRLES